jgi:signal transduction histidine kinase
VKDLFFVHLPEFTQTTTFRWTLALSGAFALCTFLMFGFVLAQAYSYTRSDADTLNGTYIALIAAEDPGARDDIAHDLRTSLTRVRVSLERARQKAGSLDELKAGEDKQVEFVVAAKENVTVHGDRDLLFEAVANLVDNAVKFTPRGGRVELSLLRKGNEAVVRVCDTGPGIHADERDLVTRRFYRSDKSRCDPGLGLGLSVVSAIAKLHGFNFTISSGPGCVAELAGQSAIA